MTQGADKSVVVEGADQAAQEFAAALWNGEAEAVAAQASTLRPRKC